MSQMPLLQSHDQMAASTSDHGLLFKLGMKIPLLSSLLWTADNRHSCGSSILDPSEPSVRAVFGSKFFRNAQGLLIHYTRWPATSTPNGKPKAVVYILHGYGEHFGRYDHVAKALNEMGYDAVGLDHQGCGQSEGDRAYVERFQDYVEDALQLITTVCPPPAGVPCFLLGVSMGGLIALHVASQSSRPSIPAAEAAAGTKTGKGAATANGLDGAAAVAMVPNPKYVPWSGLMLSAPALMVDPKVDSAMNRFLARSLSGLLPKLEVQPLDIRQLCSNQAVGKQYQRDPLNYHGAIRVRVGYEIMQAQAAMRAGAAAGLSLPLLLLHGESDALVIPQGSRWLIDAYGTAAAAAPALSSAPSSSPATMAVAIDKTFKSYPGLYHEIFNEAIGVEAIVKGDMGRWIEGHLPA